MSSEPSISTVSETLTERSEHPVREFLVACGLDVGQFPRVRFIVETPKRLFSNHQVYIPLRIPGRSGFIYESFCRVLRMTDIPAAQGDTYRHRHFIEIELRIEENPILESEHHAAFSFISGEVECPSCRSMFLPDASILDSSSIKISCPNCLHYWTIRVDSPALVSPKPTLLTDQYYHKPAEVKNEIAKWKSAELDAGTEKDLQYFPHRFVETTEGASLEWFFGNQSVLEDKPAEMENDFEVLSKSLVNHLMFHYLLNDREKDHRSNLETTEVFRKSRVKAKSDNLEETEPSIPIPNSLVAIENVQQETVGSSGLEKIEELQNQDEQAFNQTTYASQQLDGVVSPSVVRNFQISSQQFDSYNQRDVERKTKRKMLAIAASLVLGFGLVASVGNFYLESQKAQSLVQREEVLVKEKKEFEAVQATQNKELKQAVSDQGLKPKEQEVKKEASKNLPSQNEALNESLSKIDLSSNVAVSKELKVAEKPEVEKKSVKTVEEVPVIKEAKADSKNDLRASKEIENKNTDANRIAQEAFRNAYFRQGVVYLDLKKYDEAIEEFKKVIELDPKHSASYRNLGIAQLYTKKFNDALRNLEEFLKIEKNKSSDRDTIVQIVSQLKETLGESQQTDQVSLQ